MTTEYKKPLPLPANPPLTEPFWQATRRRELMVQRCRKCDTNIFYPREACPGCLAGPEWLDYKKVSGRGRVYTYTIVHQPANQALQDDVPYVYAVIQLDEGVRMIGNVVGLNDVHDVQVDMPVEAVFEDVTSDWTLVKWRPSQV